MPKHLRLVLALVLAPIVGCAIVTTVSGSAYAFLNPSRDQFDLSATIALLLVYGVGYGLTVGLAAILLFGLPAHILLTRFRQRHVWGYLLAGALAGIATPLLLMSTVSITSGESYPLARAMDDAQRTLPGAIWTGLCIAAVAWLIRRPDRDAANPTTSPP